MIWNFRFALSRNTRKRKFFRAQIQGTEAKIWQQQFLRFQMWEVLGNMREQFDWLRERIEGAIRRLADIKYTIYYAETGDVVKVMDLPIPPREIDTLPDAPAMPVRFYKVAKTDVDKEKAAELERLITRHQPDLDQQKKQLEQLNQQVSSIDNTISGLFELKKSLHGMLKRL